MEFIRDVGLALGLFSVTNIDDVFVLVALFSSGRFHQRHIVLGQYLGLGVLFAASLCTSLIAVVMALAHIGLLGLLPLALGIKGLFSLARRDRGTEVKKARGLGPVLAVTGLTIANGSDNIGVYAPVFAAGTRALVVITFFVFLVVIGVWIAFARWLTHHPTLGAPIRRFGHVLSPLVLIGLGIFILVDAGAFSKLR